MTQPDHTQRIKGFWIGLFTIAAPLAILHCLSLWQSNESIFLPVLFVFALVFTYVDWNKRFQAPSRAGWVLILLAMLAIGLLLLGWMQIVESLDRLNLRALVVTLLVSSFLASHHRTGKSQQSLVPFAAIFGVWTIFPMGSGWTVAAALRIWSSTLSGQLLDLASVSNRVHSGKFQLTSQSWTLADLIGDGYSAATVVGLGCLWWAWHQRSSILLPLYVCSAIVWAVVSDAVRLTIVALAYQWQGLDWAGGWQLHMLGLFGLLFGLAMVYSTDQLFCFIFQPSDADDSQGFNPIVWNWNRLFRAIGGNE